MSKPKILLFSTLSPYPFWAGSENLWYDFVCDKRVREELDFQIMLADSPVTRKKAERLINNGISVKFYEHFNVSFSKRNFYKILDKVSKKKYNTYPWYTEIEKESYDLVWFNIAVTNDLLDLMHPVGICQKKKIPYWLLLQLGGEGFYLGSETELDIFSKVALSAKKFIFISLRNKLMLERAVGQELDNAFHTLNAIPSSTISTANKLSQQKTISLVGTARFFSLARFSPLVKGQPLLLEAFAGKEWKSRDWQLSFIGISGFGQVYLEKLIKFYGLDRERIKITAHKNNVLEEICNHDVLLMPSSAEGTPFAMIESMACARPALGTAVGGIPELIHDGKTGWLCRTTDIGDISDKLEEAWRQRDQWSSMGMAAQKLINEFYNQDTSFEGLLKALINDVSDKPGF